ncbi:MAG: NACHT domain-containing protein [Gammaproteobacteria bacterium]|nr:NACHT domain-containing protein [Gammaproteobacteria bacterium]
MAELRDEGLCIEAREKPFPHLRMECEQHGIVSEYPAGVAEHGLDENSLRAFIEQVLNTYRHNDPRLISHLVYGGAAPDDAVRQRAQQERICLFSLLQYQGLLDFSEYLAHQTDALNRDKTYPPALYVNQRMRLKRDDPAGEQDALERVTSWLRDTSARFILILGDFGTGKTFLLHETARRLGQEENGVIPLLLEMRHLEKCNSLDILVAQQLATRNMGFKKPEQFRYMLEQGRVALLFDGYDELALRVNYDKAVEHFTTLLEAAQGEYAKVAVTSRTQHFISDKQVKQRLWDKAESIDSRRIVFLQPFDKKQILTFLRNSLGSRAEARQRMRLLEEVHDLMGLSANPRMLSFIAELPEADLRAARAQEGDITAAKLYELLLRRWLEGEYKRVTEGFKDEMELKHLQEAVTVLALKLWERTERCISLDDLEETVRSRLNVLLEHRVAAHQIGSGTLLVRDAEGYFGFIHQSVMEWLAAKAAAAALQNKRERAGDILGKQEISTLMADFFKDLAGHEAAKIWAKTTLAAEDATDTAQANAMKVLQRLAVKFKQALHRVGQELRGEDFSGQDLSGSDFSGADCTDAVFSACVLRQVNFHGAILVNADFSGADLSDANFFGADAHHALFLGAVLENTLFRDTRLDFAKFLGAHPPPQATLRFSDLDTVIRPCHQMPLGPHVALSPLGLLAAGGRNLHIWDLHTRRCLHILKGHEGYINSMAFAPDGKILASGSSDKTVRLWDAARGQCRHILKAHEGRVWSVAFAPDGGLASGSDDNTVRLWEVARSQCLYTLKSHEGCVNSVAFAPDGGVLASGSSDNTVRLWDVARGQCLHTLKGHEGYVNSVAFAPGGGVLASGSSDNTVRLWEIARGQCLHTLKGHKDWVISVAFAPDGGILASGSDDKTVRLWDAARGQCLHTLKGHDGPVMSVAFTLASFSIGTPDGETLASGSSDKTVRLWEVARDQCLHTLKGHEGWIRSVAFAPDGRGLASGSSDKTVRLWDAARDQYLHILKGHEGEVNSVAFAPNGRSLASGSDDKTVRLWEVVRGQCLHTLKGHKGWIRSVAFAPDGRVLTSGSSDGTVRLWNAARGQCLHSLKGHEGSVWSVAFASDGEVLASASSDNTVRLWEVVHGQCLCIFKGHKGTVWSVAFAPNRGILASGSDDKTVRLWDVARGQCLHTLKDHEGEVNSVAFAPDGGSLASGSDDKTVRLWDVARGQCLHTLKGHEGTVWSVAFAPDGGVLASASSDSVRLWDRQSGACLLILVHAAEGWAAYSPDGRYKFGGEVGGSFWHMAGLCRYEAGEIDQWLEKPLRLAEGERFY